MNLKDAIGPVSPESIQKNAAAMTQIRHTVALASGCAAGAFRLESLRGFGFYLATFYATAFLVVVVIGRVSRFYSNPGKALLWDGLIPSLPGYVLAWSLVYSLVET